MGTVIPAKKGLSDREKICFANYMLEGGEENEDETLGDLRKSSEYFKLFLKLNSVEIV